VRQLAFLTRLPVGRLIEVDGSDLARGVVVFPLAGAVVGGAAAAVGDFASPRLPAGVAGAIALTVAVLLTGALHLDGLADSADALGARSRDAALAIMRDPRVGSYGLAAVGLTLVVEANALAALVAGGRIAEVTSAFALSRAVAPAIGVSLPYARSADGLGRSLESGSRARAAASAAVAIGLVLLLAPHLRGIAIACATACAVGMAALFRLRFGGMTGDTLGAAIAATELACLVAACGR
jgi:adenosylcobinamide-GDP ribazoletransferase